MAMMAKINIMSAIAMEDSVFTETNISGEIESGQYRKGRFAVNYLAPGTQVSKPMNNIPYQLFQQVDRLERQLRMVGGYPVTDDSQSANSFVTGAGLSDLNSTMSLMISEYRDIIKTAMVQMDAKRLEMDVVLSYSQGISKKPMAGFLNGSAFSEEGHPTLPLRLLAHHPSKNESRSIFDCCLQTWDQHRSWNPLAPKPI